MVVNCLEMGAPGQIVLPSRGWDKLSHDLRSAIRASTSAENNRNRIGVANVYNS